MISRITAKATVCLALLGVALSMPTAWAEISLFGASSDEWLRGIIFQAQLDGGIMANPARPANGINFGDFLGDHANQAQLNQVTVKIERAIDPAKQTYQIGFTLQGLYGSDARYYHLLGVSDRLIDARYQLLPEQAHVDAHLPWLTKGGLDMRAGILQSPMGVEALDPTQRPFYTMAYTSQYSAPFEHLGAMFDWHLTPMFDVTFGVDTGNQTSWGRADNNDAAAGYFGVNVTGLLGGKLNIIELSRVGPEDARRSLGKRANTAERFWNDLSLYYTVNERLSLTGEFNYLHDDGLRAETYSFVSFLAYKISPTLTFNYRGEIYRDNTGLFVSSFLSDRAYMQSYLGESVPAESAPPTTYGALTLGVTYHPDLGGIFRVFELRPEVRFDRSLNGTHPFNTNRNTGMFTFGGDMVVGF